MRKAHERHQCHALTNQGKRCKKLAILGEQYCSIHANPLTRTKRSLLHGWQRFLKTIAVITATATLITFTNLITRHFSLSNEYIVGKIQYDDSIRSKNLPTLDNIQISVSGTQSSQFEIEGEKYSLSLDWNTRRNKNNGDIQLTIEPATFYIETPNSGKWEYDKGNAKEGFFKVEHEQNITIIPALLRVSDAIPNKLRDVVNKSLGHDSLSQRTNFLSTLGEETRLPTDIIEKQIEFLSKSDDPCQQLKAAIATIDETQRRLFEKKCGNSDSITINRRRITDESRSDFLDFACENTKASAIRGSQTNDLDIDRAKDIETLRQKGDTELLFRNYNDALSFYEKAFQEATNNSIEKGAALIDLGKVAASIAVQRGNEAQAGQLVKSICLFDNAIQYFEDIISDTQQKKLQRARAHNNRGVALNIYGNRLKDRDQKVEVFTRSKESFAAALRLYNKDQQPRLWRDVQNNLAVLTKDFAKIKNPRDADASLSTSEKVLLEIIIEESKKNQPPADLPRLYNNLGNIQEILASYKSDNDKVTKLIQAKSTYLEAEKLAKENDETSTETHPIYSKKDHPSLEWIYANNNLGNVFYQLSEIIPDPLNSLRDSAVNFYEAALSTPHMKNALLQTWATTQSNICALKYDEGSSIRYDNSDSLSTAGIRKIAEAGQHCEQALFVRKLELHPYEWAESTFNLANVYHALGLLNYRNQGAYMLEVTLETLESILERVWTRQDYPLKWAEVQHKIGFVYEDQIYLPNDLASQVDLAEQSIEFHKNALQVYLDASWQDRISEAQYYVNISSVKLSYLQATNGQIENAAEIVNEILKQGPHHVPPESELAHWMAETIFLVSFVWRYRDNAIEKAQKYLATGLQLAPQNANLAQLQDEFKNPDRDTSKIANNRLPDKFGHLDNTLNQLSSRSNPAVYFGSDSTLKEY